MQKETVSEQLRGVNDLLDKAQKEKQIAIAVDKKELVAPLLEKAKNIETEIMAKYDAKFADQLNELESQKNKLNDELDVLKISESNNAWYPNGTTVWLWEYYGSAWSSNRPLRKTDQQGVVAIYDGTQELAYPRRRWITKGDIIVIKKKKDGSLGVKFEEISNWNNLGYKAKYWCAENDTPETNPAYIKEKDEENQ